MVEVEYCSKEERKDDKRLENIVSIAKEVSDMDIFPFALMINFRDEDFNIPIMASLNGSNSINVTVYSPDKFDLAMKFAGEYEARTGENVIIKKNYDS